jgi:hypothetical protein
LFSFAITVSRWPVLLIMDVSALPVKLPRQQSSTGPTGEAHGKGNFRLDAPQPIRAFLEANLEFAGFGDFGAFTLTKLKRYPLAGYVQDQER